MLAMIACAIAPAAHAEYAVLRSGTRLHISGYELIGATVRLHISGGSVDLPAGEVLRFEPEEIFAPVLVAKATTEMQLNTPFADLIRASAAKYGLDPHLVASVVAAESNFNPRAISTKNARGLMQLMPGTSTQLSVRNPFDPAQNIDAGARYLRQMLDRFDGNLSLALAAYNAGPDSVTRFAGVPPYRETQQYVRRVTEGMNKKAASPVSNIKGKTTPQPNSSKILQ